MKKIGINDCHEILLEMVKEIHAICVKHQIPYYMLGGTMLGAIRHKGFIPWDDDIDLGIPSSYYKEFFDACKKELKNPYVFLTEENSDYAVLGIGKVMNTQTILKEKYSIDTEEQVGIFIDVFPLYTTNTQTGLFSRNRLMRSLFKLQKLVFIKSEDRSWYKKIFARFVKIVCRVDKYTLLKKIHQISRRQAQASNNEMFFNVCGAWGFKELIPVRYFGQPKLYTFEDTKLYGVEDYDSYLKTLYGDYMKLPPKSKQHIHYDNAFKID